MPDGDYAIPLGVADIKRKGTDVTVVAVAWLVHEALAAAEELAKEGISVEVVDPRTLVPLDRERSAPRCRRRAGSSSPTRRDRRPASRPRWRRSSPRTRRRSPLKAPVKRVCALNVPIPYSPVLEDHVFPDRKRIIAGIRELL